MSIFSISQTLMPLSGSNTFQ